MSILRLFRRREPLRFDDDPTAAFEHDAQKARSEHVLSEARGGLRNKVQTIQSGSRRLNVMAGALALRESFDDDNY